MAKFTLLMRCESDGSEYQIGEVEGDTPGDVYLDLGHLMHHIGRHIINEAGGGPTVDQINETWQIIENKAKDIISEEELDEAIIETLRETMKKEDVDGRETS